MGRLVLHIGQPKTGSTATQEFLSANRAALRGYGLRWCESMRGPNHLQLAVAFAEQTSHLTATAGVHGERDRARLRARLAARLGAELAQHETVLASSEHLSAALRSPTEVASLAAFLRGLADDILVLAVLRRGDYWLPSSYSEAVLNDKTVELDANLVHFRAPLLDHHAFLRRWQDGFGTSAVRLLPMLEADKRVPSAVPLRLLAELGVPADDGTSWQRPAELAHLTLSAAGTEMLRAVTPLLPRGGLRPGRDRRRVRAAIAARFPGPGVALTPAAAAELDRLGWRTSGIDALSAAAGDQWPAWRDQPPAEVRPLPEVSDQAVQELLAQLRSAGLARRRSPVLSGRARRVAVRLARR